MPLAVTRVTDTSYWPDATFQRTPPRYVLRAPDVMVIVGLPSLLMPPARLNPDAPPIGSHVPEPVGRYTTLNWMLPVTVPPLLSTPKMPFGPIRSRLISVVALWVVRIALLPASSSSTPTPSSYTSCENSDGDVLISVSTPT